MSQCTDECDAAWFAANSAALDDYMEVVLRQPPPTQQELDDAHDQLVIAYAAADAQHDKCIELCNINP